MRCPLTVNSNNESCLSFNPRSSSLSLRNFYSTTTTISDPCHLWRVTASSMCLERVGRKRLSASEGSVWARRKEAFERVGRKRLSASEGQGLDKCLITTRAWWVVSTSWEGPWRLTPPSYSHPRGRDRSHPRDREQSQPMGRERSNYTSSEGGLEVNTSFKFS